MFLLGSPRFSGAFAVSFREGSVAATRPLFVSCSFFRSPKRRFLVIFDETLGTDSVINHSKNRTNMRNEKRDPGCLGFIGDEMLPSYICGDYNKPL